MVLCEVRRLQRAIIEYERLLTEHFSLTLNEGMLLCILHQHGKLHASQVAGLLGLTMSNTSKVLRSAEEKELLQRSLCAEDKRQMCFSLTAKGKQTISAVNQSQFELPETLCKILHTNG